MYEYQTLTMRKSHEYFAPVNSSSINVDSFGFEFTNIISNFLTSPIVREQKVSVISGVSIQNVLVFLYFFF